MEIHMILRCPSFRGQLAKIIDLEIFINTVWSFHLPLTMYRPSQEEFLTIFLRFIRYGPKTWLNIINMIQILVICSDLQDELRAKNISWGNRLRNRLPAFQLSDWISIMRDIYLLKSILKTSFLRSTKVYVEKSIRNSNTKKIEAKAHMAIRREGKWQGAVENLHF